jgi:hypothetical protein
VVGFVGILGGLLLLAAKAGGGSVYFGFWGVGSGSFGGIRWEYKENDCLRQSVARFWGNRFLVFFGEG